MIYYGALAFFITSIVLAIVAIIEKRYITPLAILVSGAFLLVMFTSSVLDYGGVDLKAILETAACIPIAAGIFFLIWWIGKRRIEKQKQSKNKKNVESPTVKKSKELRKEKPAKGFCPWCGIKVTEEMVYCPNCGKKLRE